MKYIKLKNEPIPALGLGTYLLDGAVATSIVEQAISLGYRHVDTAQFYDNEKAVGQGIKNSEIPRGRIFLVTKVWPTNLSKDKFLPSVEESLRKLQTDYVDLLLIHWPHASLPLGTYLEELVKAQEQGKARFIGLSNFNIGQLEQSRTLGVPVLVNQVEFHPFIDQSKLYDWMRRHKMPLMAYTPLAQGRVPGNSQLEAIGEKYGKSSVQITLRWMMQLEGVFAIPKSANPARLKANLDIFDFELSEDDMASINAMQRGNKRFVDAFHGASWDS